MQSVNIPYPTSYLAPALLYTDLGVGLPERDYVTTNSIWSISPENDTVNPNQWSAKSGVLNYKDPKSIVVRSSGVSGVVTRSMGSNVNLTDWELNFKYMFNGQANHHGTMYLDILDNNNKVIVRLDYFTEYTNGSAIKINNTILKAGITNYKELLYGMPLISIKLTATQLRLKYNDTVLNVTQDLFDPTANWRNPTTMRIQSTAGSLGRDMGMADMQFYKTV